MLVKGELIGIDKSKTKRIYIIILDRKDKLYLKDKRGNGERLTYFLNLLEITDIQLRTMMTRTH